MNKCVVKEELINLIEAYFDQSNKLKSVFKDCKNKRSLLYILEELSEHLKHWIESLIELENASNNEEDSFKIVEKDVVSPIDLVNWVEIDQIPSNWRTIISEDEMKSKLYKAQINIMCDPWYQEHKHDSETIFQDCVSGEYQDLIKDACLAKLTEQFCHDGKIDISDDEVREELISYLCERFRKIKVIGKVIYDGSRKD